MVQQNSTEQAAGRVGSEHPSASKETAKGFTTAPAIIQSAQGDVQKESKPPAYPLPQVVGENQVPGEGVGEGCIEF